MEFNTSNRIAEFISRFNPTTIIKNIGGAGLAAVYEFASHGPSIVIRCELDALPMPEENDFIHRSKTNNISHKCGHDGHMAIVAGLIFWIKKQKFNTGRIVLLFQPAEETGEGAYKVIQDHRFSDLYPEYIFALHNIPGEKTHSIISISSGFSAEVISFSILLKGIESHASEPERGINPSSAIASLITDLLAQTNSDPFDTNFAILTPIHINMGQKSYGISPSNAELHYTIRTWDRRTMTELRSKIEELTNKVSQANSLDYEINWFEYFPAAENNSECNDYISQAAKENNFEIVERPYPFKFGEDFGWFSSKYKSAMFGLGAGIDCPPLHNAKYDFRDELIETGMNMFQAIITKILH
jgi:amidohydrolase